MATTDGGAKERKNRYRLERSIHNFSINFPHFMIAKVNTHNQGKGIKGE